MTRAERECEGPHHREHEDHQSLPVHAGPSDPAYGHHHTYDPAGNRTEVRENGAPVADLRYNDANQVIGWSYDAAGNLLSDGTGSRSYDALNRLVAHDSTSYTYNGNGVLVSDGTTTYAQDLAAPLSQVLNDGTANYVYGHERLRVLGGPWYVGDALGSVRQTLDDVGAVVATTNYDPWGTPQDTLSAPFGFTGELHSAGQVSLRARWYAPGQGRFVSEDPFAGFAEMPYSLHAYQYGYSNPVLWTDPSGECVPYPVNPFDPDCRFLGWNPAHWNWEDGRAYYYSPAGTIGKMALMGLFPPAAYVFGAENAALSYIRYHENPTECNGVLVIVDTTLAVLPFASLVKFGGGAGPMMQGGTQVLTAAQSQLLRLEVATVAVGAGYIPNIFAATTGDGSGDPSGKGSGTGPRASDITWKGFANKKLKTHYDKHVIENQEFGDISQNEYLLRAKTFAGDTTRTAVREGNVSNIVVKVDMQSREVFIGHVRSRQIRTYYIADYRASDPFEAAMQEAQLMTSNP